MSEFSEPHSDKEVITAAEALETTLSCLGLEVRDFEYLRGKNFGRVIESDDLGRLLKCYARNPGAHSEQPGDEHDLAPWSETAAALFRIPKYLQAKLDELSGARFDEVIASGQFNGAIISYVSHRDAREPSSTVQPAMHLLVPGDLLAISGVAIDYGAQGADPKDMLAGFAAALEKCFDQYHAWQQASNPAN